MSSSCIGIRVVNGSFFPVLEEGFAGKKRLILTTVEDNQTRLQIDLHTLKQGSNQADLYIGTLVIENIERAPEGEQEIEVILSVDTTENVRATATDLKTGASQSISVNIHALTSANSYEISESVLDAQKTRLRKNEEGETTAFIEGKTVLLGNILSVYPISNKQHFISLRDHEGKEIGIIEQAHELDHESRIVVREEIEKSYFLPKIHDVLAVEDHLNLFTFRVETDKGSRMFEVRHPRQNIRSLGNGRYIIKDVDGNRYDIPKLRNLGLKAQIIMREFV